jgi:leucyl aminopeptidase
MSYHSKGSRVYESIRVSEKTPAHPHISVCLLFSDKTLQHCDQRLDAKHQRVISTAVKRADVKGETGELTVIQSGDGSLLALLGLGKRKEFGSEKVRTAFGKLMKGLRKLDAPDLLISVPEDMLASTHALDFGRAIGEGLGLANWKFESYKKKSSDESSSQELSVSFAGSDAAEKLARGCSHGLSLSESTNFARQLAATPPNIATTNYIAEQAQELAAACGNLKCSVIKGAALKKYKLVGLENVGKASEHPPCMIELSYTPKGKFTKTMLLVGKTICYDTGGLSIKTREGMHGMKYDKCGGMAVLGAMHAVSRINPNFRVIGLLPTAENSISDNAMRVDDIITYPNGVSVEVTNTDAEGRLVLADGLIYGCRTYHPDAVIDLATLTGGVVVGLGKTFAGYWCEDEELRTSLEAASSQTGERVWRLPMHDDYKEMMKAKQADLWNSAPTRDAHPIQGAAFLSSFIDAKIPWVHLDIAGVADIDRDKAPYCAGPTGFGVRLLASLIEQW